jgi:hypothetical protein
MEMDEQTLNTGELFFIEVVRNFDFLRSLGYFGSKFSIYGKEQFVQFEHRKSNHIITVIMLENCQYDVYVEKRSLFNVSRISIKDDILKTNHNITIKELSKYLQKNIHEFK